MFALVAILIFGSTFPVSKPVVAVLDPFAFGSSRFLLSGLGILAFLWLRGWRPRFARRDLPMLAAASVCFGTFHALWGFGLPLIPASTAAILMATSPVFGALIDTARGNRPGPLAWLGMAAAFAGVVCVINNSFSHLEIPQEHLLGGGMWLAAACCWALYSGFGAPLSNRLGAVPAVATTTLGGALLLAPLALVFGWEAHGFDMLDTRLWLQYAYMAVVGAGLSLLAWYGALRRLGTTRGIAYMYLVPVAATLLSWAFLGEPITLARLAGMAAVLFGVWLIRRGTPPPP
ncbi:MAG: DMT family transporter [Sneathiellaceae bacterium]